MTRAKEPSPATPVGWGIVGCGWIATDYAVPALELLAATGEARPVACWDADPGRAEQLAARSPGLVAVGSLAELVAAPGVDAVYVATPNSAHCEGALGAADAGRAVLVEKPLAADRADAVALVKGCAGVLAGTAFDQRWHPAHRRLAELVAGGAVGEVTAVRIVYCCWLPPSWSASAASPADNWRVDPARAGGGAGIDLAPHAVDLIGCVLGEDILRLQALSATRVHAYAVDDTTVLVGRTGSGTVASVHVSYAMPETLPRRRLEVVGTRGQLVAVDTMGQTPGGSLTLTDAADGAATDIAFDVALSPFVAQLQSFSAAVAGGQWDYPLDRDLRLHELLLDALAAGGRQS